MKFNHKLLSAFLMVGIIITGCQKVLDKENIGSFNPDIIWNNQSAAESYVYDIYADLMPAFALNEGRNSDEASMKSNESPAHLRGTATIDEWDYWDYDAIRKINVLLEEIDGGSIAEAVKAIIKGEAHFWRAWAYFNMVKAYGGVPLILTVQSKEQDDDLYKPRNKTSECMAAIFSDLDKAVSLLPASWPGATLGRVDKAAAFAFKGRVALYYASPQFNPQNLQQRWTDAYNINKTALDSCTAYGKALFPNFQNIWYELNSEVILAKQYRYPELVYNSNGVRPIRWAGEHFGWDWPSLELALAFPMKDGTRYDLGTSGYELLFKDRDPRYYATIAYNGSDYGIKDLVTLNAYLWTYHKEGLPDFEGALYSNTSFYRNKAIDKSLDFANASNATVPWVEIRFTEVLMNYGEAANEVGNTNEALQILYLVRQRAGIDPGPSGNYGIMAVSQSEIREAYMNERFLELAFENKRFWDLRRLRKFEMLNGTSRHGLYITLKDGFMPPLNKEDIAQIYDHFIYDIREVDQQPIAWKENYYFFGIPKKYLDRNGNLEQTQGWDNGSFDPLE